MLDSMRGDLVAALRRPLSECAPAAMVDKIAALERLDRCIQAELLRVVHALDVTQTATDKAAGVGPRLTGRTVPAQVAAARGVATSTARHQIELARSLVEDHPVVFGHVRSGRISLAAARRVSDETQPLRRMLRLEVDTNLGDLLEERSFTPAQLQDAAARQVIGVDPTAALARCEAERSDRRVSVFEKHHGTATIWAKLKAEEALAVERALDAEARAMRSAGDVRSVTELMCDVFVHRLTSLSAPALPLRLGEDTDEPAQPLRSRALRRRLRHRRSAFSTRRVEVQVVMAASTFLGIDDAPATLRGYGAIPVELARRIADDPHADPVLRRLICDPVDGRLLSMDTHTRCYEGSARRFACWRDQSSRFPFSGAPIRDVDHLLEHAAGGPTTPGNGQGLDKSSHVIRDHPDVHVRAVTLDELRANAPTIRWMLPSGHCYDSDPPPALGHGSTFRSPPRAAPDFRAMQADQHLKRIRRKLRKQVADPPRRT